MTMLSTGGRISTYFPVLPLCLIAIGAISTMSRRSKALEVLTDCDSSESRQTRQSLEDSDHCSSQCSGSLRTCRIGRVLTLTNDQRSLLLRSDVESFESEVDADRSLSGSGTFIFAYKVLTGRPAF